MTKKSTVQRKRVAAINDLSGVGKCSLTVAIPILSALGVEACPVTTAVLTSQTGYGSFYMHDFTGRIKNYIAEWKKHDICFNAIYSGFVSGEAQIEEIKEFIQAFKEKETFVLVDPVMGDSGKIYATYTKAVCEKMVELITLADVVTPNLTEACIITEQDYSELIEGNNASDYLERVCKIAEKVSDKGPKTVVITGVLHTDKNGEKYIHNVCYNKKTNQHIIKKAMFSEVSYPGTGDIFASILCGCLVNGALIESAVTLATEFLEKSVNYSATVGGDVRNGIFFERFLKLLTDHAK